MSTSQFRKNSRTASGSGSIRQRKDGRWEGRVTVGVNPATGKPIRRSIYGDTQAEVRKTMTAILREVDNGTYQTPSKITVSQWMTIWMDTFCRPTLKPYTVSQYDSIIKRYVNPAIGGTEIQRVRGVDVQKLYNSMTQKGLSPKTVKNAAAVLHKALSTAVKQGLISANPCDAADLPKAEHHEIKPLTDAEIPLFMQAIEDHRFRNAYALCLFCGLREGECLGLSWSQVDFSRGRITISQQLQRSKQAGGGYYIAPSTKSGRPRTITPPPIAFQYLKDEQRRQLEHKFAAGPAWDNPDDLVFTDESGKHLATHTFYKDFKRIAESIGRPDLRPHDLRHTAATIAISSGADIKSVQDMLGHATASFTLNVYAHTSDKMMEDTATRMQSYFENIEKMG